MIRAIVSLLAAAATAAQGIFILLRGEGFCFNNEGCRIVDSLTTVSPLFFNIAGGLFFIILYQIFRRNKNDSEFWQGCSNLLLLAGVAAEGVLVFFQYRIATVFCSYCLMIFGFIILLTILSGLRQCIYALSVFLAVIIAFAGLQFKTEVVPITSLDSGSFARISGSQKGGGVYLFFSSSCPHCKEILAVLKKENICTIRFNPIEKITSLDFSGVEKFSGYDPVINLNFLHNLSIDEIPVLLVKNVGEMKIIEGERRIRKYLQDNCSAAKPAVSAGEGVSGDDDHFLFSGEQAQDKCTVTEGCGDSSVPSILQKDQDLPQSVN